MPELDVAVVTERVLQLIRTPLFEDLTLEQLETVAASGREVVYPKRTVLVPEGERPHVLYVALTGRLRALHAGEPLPGDPVQQFYGGLGVLSGMSVLADIVVEPGTVLFVLDEDSFRALLEEHASIARSILRSLSGRALDARKGQLVGSTGKVRIQPERGPASVDILGRMLLLRDALGLQSRNLAVLAQLARTSQVRRVDAGKTLFEPTSGDSDVVVVLEGTLELCQVGLGPSRAQTGQALGLIEAIARRPMPCPGVTLSEVTCLVLGNNELQEAIEDHDDFCMDLLRLVAFEILRQVFPSSTAAA